MNLSFEILYKVALVILGTTVIGCGNNQNAELEQLKAENSKLRKQVTPQAVRQEAANSNTPKSGPNQLSEQDTKLKSDEVPSGEASSNSFIVIHGHDKEFSTSHKPDEGELKSIGRYENGQRTGVWVSVRDAELISTTEWRSGRLDGLFVCYKHSRPTHCLEYSEGKRHGWLWILPESGKNGIADEFAYGKGVSDLDEYGNPKSYTEPPKYTKAKMLSTLDEHQRWAAEVLVRILTPDEVREILRKHEEE